MPFTLIQTLCFMLTFVLNTGIAEARVTSLEGRPKISIRVNNIKQYDKQYLTVYLARGRLLLINLGRAGRPYVQSVVYKWTTQIDASQPTIEFQAPPLKQSGFELPANMIIFVIHDTESFYWVNADGTIPKNEEPDGSNIERLVRYHLMSLSHQGTSPVEITINDHF